MTELARIPRGASDAVGPDRNLPQLLIDIALRALRRGSTDVFLGYASAGYDFDAPIGWIMWIRRLDADESEMISYRIGDELTDDELPVWLRADADADETTTLVPLLIDLFETAARNGWDVDYQRLAEDHRMTLRVLSKLGGEDTLGMRHAFKASASNWGYDQAARDRGDNVSDNVYISVYDKHLSPMIVFSDDGGTHRRVPLEHGEALLRAQAPFFRPVAYFDEEHDLWVK